MLGTTGKKKNAKTIGSPRKLQMKIQKKKTAYIKWMSSKSIEDRNIYTEIKVWYGLMAQDPKGRIAPDTEIKRSLNHRIRSIKYEYWDRKYAEINSYLAYKRSAQVWKNVEEHEKRRKT